LGHGLGAHARKYPDEVIWTLLEVNISDLLKYWKDNPQSTAGLHIADLFNKAKNSWLHQPTMKVLGKEPYDKTSAKVGWDWAAAVVYV
jgi:hypothetical protein